MQIDIGKEIWVGAKFKGKHPIVWQQSNSVFFAGARQDGCYRVCSQRYPSNRAAADAARSFIGQPADRV
jgi:hypothetical protein